MAAGGRKAEPLIGYANPESECATYAPTCQTCCASRAGGLFLNASELLNPYRPASFDCDGDTAGALRIAVALLERYPMPAVTIPSALEAFDSLPDSAHVGVRVVAGLYGCAVPTVWRRAREKRIPSPRKFGASSRWNVGELRADLAANDDDEAA
ncbi:putative DNA-binding transcriptional regulator AlpA [Paraburkholderia sp. WSM4175]|uniref:helix-turn-helix transcriptional regulator n=1 Tax=Paraburkholderia sp. WSM4175 TaxID=2991072 RepID=UPI003D227407